MRRTQRFATKFALATLQARNSRKKQVLLSARLQHFECDDACRLQGSCRIFVVASESLEANEEAAHRLRDEAARHDDLLVGAHFWRFEPS